MVKPETYLQRRIQKALKEEFLNSLWWKVHGGPYQRKGIPDLVGCIAGFYIAIEVKCPGKEGTVTPIQRAAIKSIKQAGGIAFVATSPDGAIRVGTHHLNSHIYRLNRMGKTWQNIKTRCYNRNTPYYKKYGGKGIRMCDRWLKGVFFFWQDMGFPPYEEDKDGNVIRYSIDRIDSDGDYTPENCQWLSLSENSGKNSQNRFITYKGERKTVKGWCTEFELHYNTLHMRLERGWSIHKALTTPARTRRALKR